MDRAKKGIDAYRSVLGNNPEKRTRTTNDREENGIDVGTTAKPSPQKPEGFVKTGSASIDTFRKVAKFLLLIGKQASSEILPFLSKDELEIVTREMSRIDTIDEAEAARILGEFGQRSPSKRTGEGGPETAREILHTAFGEESGEQLFHRAVPFGGRIPFDFLADLDADQLTLLLRKEPLSVLSIVLPHLDANPASRVLEALSPDTQKELVKRIAKMGMVHPEAIATTEDGLRQRLRKLGAGDTEEIDGVAALAEILRKMDTKSERAILDHLTASVPEVSDAVRKRLFSLESLSGLTRRDLEKVLRDFEDDEIALVLKGRDEETIETVLACVSLRRREAIREEIVRLGPVRRSDLETATEEFLEHVRVMAEKGDIHLAEKDDMYV